MQNTYNLRYKTTKLFTIYPFLSSFEAGQPSIFISSYDFPAEYVRKPNNNKI